MHSIVSSLRLMVLLAFALVGCSDDPGPSADAADRAQGLTVTDVGGPFRIVGTVRPATNIGRVHHRVVIRAEGQPTAHATVENGRFRSRVLTRGRVEVICRLPMDVNGPWLHWSRVIDGTDGGTHELEIAREPGSARLLVQPEPGSPPFFMFLTAPDVEVPTHLQRFKKWVIDDAMPASVRFSMMSDGNSNLRLPLLPEGRFRAWVVANDWEPGDPKPEVRGVDLSLVAGGDTILALKRKLVVLEVRGP